MTPIYLKSFSFIALLNKNNVNINLSFSSDFFNNMNNVKKSTIESKHLANIYQLHGFKMFQKTIGDLCS